MTQGDHGHISWKDTYKDVPGSREINGLGKIVKVLRRKIAESDSRTIRLRNQLKEVEEELERLKDPAKIKTKSKEPPHWSEA